MRLDQALVAQGLAPSRARARALIEAGVVTVAGRVVTRPAAAAEGDLAVTADPCPWVSRGALKLVHALDSFGLSPAGAEALDIGASTGGFTEVLLARGARHVVALDVGHGQLDGRLRGDARVTPIEGVNARDLSAGQVEALLHRHDWHPDWIVADVSFISLTKALPPALALAAPGAVLVVLVKPQFEVGPGAVGKGGIVRDPEARRRAVASVRQFLADSGWTVIGETPSPVAGSDGNREVLVAAQAANGRPGAGP